MKKKTLAALLCLLCLCLLAGCGGSGASSAAPAPAAAPASTAPAKATTLGVTVSNSTGYIFNELYVSPTGSDSWGTDHLGSTSILKANGSYDITVDAYEYGNYDILVVDEDGDEYAFKYVKLDNGCEAYITLDGEAGVTVSHADGSSEYTAGTLNGESGAAGGEAVAATAGAPAVATATGTGYDTNGRYSFTVYNESDYDIYSIHMGVANAGSSEDLDILPVILAAHDSTDLVGQASQGDWINTEWTLYITDVDGDSSASYDTFNPWTVSYVDVTWDSAVGGYVCSFAY